MTVPLLLVDAFTTAPFGGNPAGVCVLDEPADESWMQSLAAELKQSETAFVHPIDGGAWSLRWFTPVAEVDLCGHATLASAHALWTTGAAPDDGSPIAFDTASGLLVARRDGTAILLDFPATPPEPADPPDGLLAALGVDAVAVARTKFDWLVEVGDVDTVVGASPDTARLAQVEGRGTMLTAAGGENGADFTSRFFAPALGIDEDPVTGSAHCALGPYWAPRVGRTELVGRQASPRGGRVGVRVLDDRVELSGQATTVLTGTLAEPPSRAA